MEKKIITDFRSFKMKKRVKNLPEMKKIIRKKMMKRIMIDGNLGEWKLDEALALWDTENCPLPRNYCCSHFIPALRQFLQHLGFWGNLRVIGVCGDLSDHTRVPARTKKHLSEEGVQFTDWKTGRKRVPKNAADYVILRKLIRFMRSKSQAPLLLIAGDGI